MVLIVLRSRELHDELGKRFPPKSIYRAMHPTSTATGSSSAASTSARASSSTRRCRRTPRGTISISWGCLHEATGFPFKAEFDHVGFWDLRVAVAEKYQVGRVFIAGDAAHALYQAVRRFGLNNDVILDPFNGQRDDHINSVEQGL